MLFYIICVERITYPVLEIHAEKIRELVTDKKYRDPEDFLKNAVEILLTWETGRPWECVDLMRTRTPLSPEQEEFASQIAKCRLYARSDGLPAGAVQGKTTMQKAQIIPDYHAELINRLPRIKEYVGSLAIKEPAYAIPYDGYPLLLGFYSRFLPVKIVMATMGYMLEKHGNDRVELGDLRSHACGIAQEIAVKLGKYESMHNIPRNQKRSTGLPKKGNDDGDDEKIFMAQKRFKDQFVGKIRKSRVTRTRHFEGAVAALGLAHAFEEDGSIYMSLTDFGKEFILLDNPIVSGDYKGGSLSSAESHFILKSLIPQRELEQRFVAAAVDIIENFDGAAMRGGPDGKITNAIDSRIREIAAAYIRENPKAGRLYGLAGPDSEGRLAGRRITQWRLATMGRLSELGVVGWEINRRGDSEFFLKYG